MAVGDDATAAGFSLVPDTGEEGRVRWGAREITAPVDADGKPDGTVYLYMV